ncbi:hypothetical protein BDN70DRAFT_922737 [Pholiota conissans]|uniref:Uncharacterized protein n=1 Tax=Pholiota conissans TaxID=109636 RepID=A0A9P5YXF7_9AGAR|nr:hypothetical protein BDN70DRAFT_922737 [Pholiota conissans]
MAEIPNLFIIVTMRGTQRPSKVLWSHPLPPLSTLSSSSARIILQKISPSHVVDDYTEKLLDAIEGIPLAIMLISNLLRDWERAQTLWKRWLKEQTSMIETGGEDRESSLNASIALSVHSPRMTKDPDAQTLLAALSLPPHVIGKGFPGYALPDGQRVLNTPFTLLSICYLYKYYVLLVLGVYHLTLGTGVYYLTIMSLWIELRERVKRVNEMANSTIAVAKARGSGEKWTAGSRSGANSSGNNDGSLNNYGPWLKQT